ncbi:MAG: citramalate synthase [bacterium]
MKRSKAVVRIYDTTLRDGTQGEGISFNVAAKLAIAKKLDEFGVDYIEGGWPGSNPKDMEFFLKAAETSWQKAKITAFGSTRKAGLKAEEDPQLIKLLESKASVVTIFGKTSLVHVRKILSVTPSENCQMIMDSVAFLRSKGREVIYDAEHFFDGAKEDWSYAIETLLAAKNAGADTIVLCDTNGGTLPDEIGRMVKKVVRKLCMPIGVHTHNDSECAVANALAAVRSGAVHVQGTVNGYGERVGNCNLTSLIPNLEFKMGIKTVPDLTKLRELSRFVEELANVPCNTRLPYVGQLAFTHKGGIHVHAVEKLTHSYEHVDPSRVGNNRRFLVSELAGQLNILNKAKELGFSGLEKGSPEVKTALTEIKRLENEGYEFEAADASFSIVIRRILGSYQPAFELLEYHTSFRRSMNSLNSSCEATVKIKVGEIEEYTVASGDGPVNALDFALRKALSIFFPQVNKVSLVDYNVRILTGDRGSAAKTRVLILSTDGEKSWGTVGVSDNIIEASWLALVDGFEYWLQKNK